MRATVIYGPADVRLETVPDPSIQLPTDAVVRVVASCVCGSDLWAYRGVTKLAEPRRYGHEFVGVVEDVGTDVRSVRPGDFVVAPFNASDGSCPHCQHGVPSCCDHVAWWGSPDEHGLFVDAGQGEAVRVPMADGTLVPTPEMPDPSLVPSLLTLTDVMATGHHAALRAGLAKGETVVVVGDGAVGLCAVMAARRLGADRIIAMSSRPDRQALATAFGATDVVAERGAEGAAKVVELTGGVGADRVLECVGTQESIEQALGSVRPGGGVGIVGLPHGLEAFPFGQLFGRNLTVGGGATAVRTYLPELLDDVLAGSIDPGRVFDLELPLDQVAEAYAAMDERRSIKTLLRP